MSLGVLPLSESRSTSSIQTTKYKANGGSWSPLQRPHHRSSVSYPTVRAQFSALSVEDRLEFLSWLFEGALSHCISRPII
ncbi:hypothetical protein ACN38_g4460 [Penicillium nordicum]|uniref:Uncharacterized protein n=1 Tax=Penicillium nordicum TaxID=229535 RepID=A0A0M8PBC4_9EURO|nr:hypothetical protein ACN38_g4460 [Penicillium nordicum]